MNYGPGGTSAKIDILSSAEDTGGEQENVAVSKIREYLLTILLPQSFGFFSAINREHFCIIDPLHMLAGGTRSLL